MIVLIKGNSRKQSKIVEKVVGCRLSGCFLTEVRMPKYTKHFIRRNCERQTSDYRSIFGVFANNLKTTSMVGGKQLAGLQLKITIENVQLYDACCSPPEQSNHFVNSGCPASFNSSSTIKPSSQIEIVNRTLILGETGCKTAIHSGIKSILLSQMMRVLIRHFSDQMIVINTTLFWSIKLIERAGRCWMNIESTSMTSY